MITGAPRRTSVQLNTSQMGDFLVLTGRSSVSRAGHSEPVLSKTALTEAEPADEEAASIQMMMCKRIVELHAGELRVTGISVDASPFLAPSRIESFVLTLMTSMPAHERSHASCADCRRVGQALSFASDMAQLIASNQTTISDRSLKP
jgi:hypothetical protein